MSIRNTHTDYGSATRFLHTLIAALVLIMLALGVVMGYLPKPLKGDVVGIHKLIGLCTLSVALLFVLWTLSSKKPGYPDGMKTWEKHLARTVQTAMYLLIILMPLSGWTMATAANKPPHIFGLYAFPMPFIPLSKPLAGFAKDSHTIMAWILFACIVLHTCGALKHHFIDKNNILKRMLGHK